jgi:hypothetical protein
LRDAGLRVVEVGNAGDQVLATLAALQAGADVVVQAALAVDGWRGYADVLRRIETPSAFGRWNLLDEPNVIVGLELVERRDVVRHKTTKKPTGSVTDRYRFPAQDMALGRKAKLTRRDGKGFGEVVSVDRERRLIDIRKGPACAEQHPAIVFGTSVVDTDVLQRSVMRLAEDPDALTCGLDLLHRRRPRLSGAALARQPGEADADLAVRLVHPLDRGTLAVQGPPGSGKTCAGARMIRALVGAGKRVGVTAVSHKVIRNLLDAATDQAAEAGEPVRLAHRTDRPARRGRVSGADNWGQRGGAARARRAMGGCPRGRARVPDSAADASFANALCRFREMAREVVLEKL